MHSIWWKDRATMQSAPRFRLPCARRWLAHIVPAVLAPALFACSASQPAQQPLSPQALAAVIDDPGVEREGLARAIDALFQADGGSATQGAGETRAVIVMRAGRIVAERYGPGYHENTRFAGGGIARSITAVMVGMLVSDGRLRLNETAPVPAWQRPGDPRGEITLRHLLQMRSGLREEPGDEARMLFGPGRDDMAGGAWVSTGGRWGACGSPRPASSGRGRPRTSPWPQNRARASRTMPPAGSSWLTLPRGSSPRAATPMPGAARWPITCAPACSNRCRCAASCPRTTRTAR